MRAPSAVPRIDRIRQDQVEHAAVDVDVSDPHQLAVAQPMPAAGSAADQRVRSLLRGSKNRRSGWKRGSGRRPAARQPAEEPEIFDPDDDRVKGLADAVFQVGQQLDSDQVALGGLGPPLGPSAVLAQARPARRDGCAGFLPSSQAINWRWTCRSG